MRGQRREVWAPLLLFLLLKKLLRQISSPGFPRLSPFLTTSSPFLHLPSHLGLPASLYSPTSNHLVFPKSANPAPTFYKPLPTPSSHFLSHSNLPSPVTSTKSRVTLRPMAKNSKNILIPFKHPSPISFPGLMYLPNPSHSSHTFPISLFQQQPFSPSPGTLSPIRDANTSSLPLSLPNTWPHIKFIIISPQVLTPSHASRAPVLHCLLLQPHILVSPCSPLHPPCLYSMVPAT